MCRVIFESIALAVIALPVSLNAQTTDPTAETAGVIDSNDERFHSEAVDLVWAPQMEATLWSVLSAAASDKVELRVVRCRTTVCEATLERTEAFLKMEREEQLQYQAREMMLVLQSLGPLIRDPNGRLNQLRRSGASFSEARTATYWLSGPPLVDETQDSN